MKPGRRTVLGVVLAVLVGALGAACSGARTPGPVTERHPLPRLPGLGSVLLPEGFVVEDRPTLTYASRHPVHVDSAFFAFDPSTDLGGNRRCRAQIAVSPHDPHITTPAGYVDELGTKLSDAAWFVTAFDPGWRQPDPADPDLWVLRFSATDAGWFGVSEVPAVAVVLFEPERGISVGLWAREEVYSPEDAVAVAREVARSVG